MSSSSFRTSTGELGGGRIAILLLLFALALYQFYHAGFGAFAMICLLPVLALFIILSFKYRMFLFWTLVFVNYLVAMMSFPWPEGIPTSLYNEILEILLIVLVIIDVKDTKFDYALNTMLLAIIIWCSFITLELLNDTCGFAFDFPTWFPDARKLAFQILYAFLVFSLYINNQQKLLKYLYIWGALALFSVFWIWKQKNMGLTSVESTFIQTSKTHLVNNGTLVRYFSIYTDAAAAGIGMASTAVAFIIFGLTSKVRKYKLFFLLVGAACTWGFFPTGTRTAMACFLAGFVAYTILAKSLKLSLFVGAAGLVFFFILAFTNIGNGNQMIRRMRTTFDRNDASAGARSANQETMKKYLADILFGIGVGVRGGDVAENHTYYVLSTIPPDSEYVGIWIHTGIVGITIFLITTALMFLGACRVILFKLTSSSLRGVGAGLACAFSAVQLGGYGNQVLLQFPNCFVFYGGLSLIYILPYIEQEWIAHENKLLAVQEEKKRLKEEKKKNSRV